MTGTRPYDRRAGFLYTDDIVKVVDYDGNEALFKIQRHEPIGMHSVKFTSRVVNGGITPGNRVFADFRFLQPARENRLFEVRPILFAVRQMPLPPLGTISDGRLIFAPTPMASQPGAGDFIPMGVELVWRDPAGMARGGTDLEFPVTVNITAPSPPTSPTTPSVGGVNGGFVEAVMVPLIDDFSDLYKMHAIYGHTIEYGIANRTDIFPPGGGVTIGGVGDNKQYFVGVVGRKHLLGPVPEEIKKKVDDEEIPYKTITIGGIPIVTTRA